MTNSIIENILKLPKKSSGNIIKSTKGTHSLKHFTRYNNITAHDVFTIAVVLLTVIVIVAHLTGE